MAHLAVGDVVAVGGGEYSEVFFFSHADQEAVTDMISLSVSTAAALAATATAAAAKHSDATITVVLSPGHLVALNRGGLVASRDVQVGDTVVLENGGDGIVTAVKVVEKAAGRKNSP